MENDFFKCVGTLKSGLASENACNQWCVRKNKRLRQRWFHEKLITSSSID